MCVYIQYAYIHTYVSYEYKYTNLRQNVSHAYVIFMAVLTYIIMLQYLHMYMHAYVCAYVSRYVVSIYSV